MSPILLGAIAALAWGTHDFGARFAGHRIGVLTTLLCVTITGLIGLTVWLVVIGADMPSFRSDGFWLIVAMGAGYALATLWIYEAFTRGPFALVSPIVGAYPVTALLIFAALGTYPPLLQWIAIAVVLVGVAIVAGAVRPDDDGADAVRLTPSTFRAVVGYALLAHLAFAVALTAGQFAAPLYGEVQATWLARIVGLVVVGGVVLRNRDALRRVPLRWSPALIGMGLCDVSALAAVSTAGHGPGAELATVVSSAFGMVTILLAWVILRERIRPLQWFGIVLVFGGTAYLAA